MLLPCLQHTGCYYSATTTTTTPTTTASCYSKVCLLKPSERSLSYIDMATHHHLDIGPRGQPLWCYSIFAQPNNHMATHHHYLHTSWASYKQPRSSPIVPAQYVCRHSNIHMCSWAGDPKLTMETFPGFAPYPSRPGIFDQDIWRRVNTVWTLAAKITPHIFRYRTTTTHSGTWILQWVDDVAASCWNIDIMLTAHWLLLLQCYYSATTTSTPTTTADCY